MVAFADTMNIKKFRTTIIDCFLKEEVSAMDIKVDASCSSYHIDYYNLKSCDDYFSHSFP